MNDLSYDARQMSRTKTLYLHRGSDGWEIRNHYGGKKVIGYFKDGTAIWATTNRREALNRVGQLKGKFHYQYGGEISEMMLQALLDEVAQEELEGITK